MAEPELVVLALGDSQVPTWIEPELRAAGFDVAVFRGSNELEQALVASSPAVMLISEVFDSKNGLEIAARVHQQFPALPVVLLANTHSRGTLGSALVAGLSGYLPPAFTQTDLVDAVRSGLARARTLSDTVDGEVGPLPSDGTEAARLPDAENTRLETILAELEDGLIVLDESRNIILFNRTARKAFRLGELSPVGKRIEHVLLNDDWLALLARPAAINLKDYELEVADGRMFNTQYTRIPGVGSAITMQDISHLKRIDQAKSDFVHTVSHDLRSPLTAVLGYAELLGRVGPLNEQQREFLQHIQGGVQNITTLVNDLLDLGRLEAGIDTRREMVQLGDILRSSLAFLESLIRKKDIHLEQRIGVDLPSIRADPVQIRQMSENLITNAIKYTPERGEIRIQLTADGDQIILEVSDNGPGIPLDDQAHIFEKFYRATNIAGADRGSGLGLAIVKTIVDNYFGRVWVESAPGRGASFFVVLPASKVGEAK